MNIKVLFLLMMWTVIAISCGGPSTSSQGSRDTASITGQEDTLWSSTSEPEAERYNLWAEQVVEAWLYEHLLNFSSYHCLIPEIEPIGEEEGWWKYDYSTRYTATNTHGGTETNTLNFRVSLLIDASTGALSSYEVVNTTPDSSLVTNHTLIRQ